MNAFRSGFFSSIPPVTKNLIIVNALFWLASLVLPRVGVDLYRYLGLHYFQAEQFNVAQLVTYMFMHDPNTITHLFFNMFSLYMFGRTLEQVWGPKRFLIYYLVTGIGAGVVQEAVWAFQLMPLHLPESFLTPEGIQVVRADLFNRLVTVGASGAVFGILLAFGMLFPNVPLFLIFVPIPIKAKYFVIFYGILELFLGVGNFGGDNVAHFAHLGGMLFGLILILRWKKKNPTHGSFF